MKGRLKEITEEINKLTSIPNEDIISAIRKINKKVTCPYCNSDHVVKIGFIYRRNNIKIQRFKCQKCGKTFSELDGTPLKGVHSLKDIILVAYLVLMLGMPPSSISRVLGINRSRVYRMYERITGHKKFSGNYSIYY